MRVMDIVGVSLDIVLYKCFLLSTLLCAKNAFDGTEERKGYASVQEEAAACRGAGARSARLRTQG